MRVALQSILNRPEDEGERQTERSRLRGVTFATCSKGSADGGVRECQERKEGWWGGVVEEEEDREEEGWEQSVPVCGSSD